MSGPVVNWRTQVCAGLKLKRAGVPANHGFANAGAGASSERIS
jgi:hypothetical protein